MYIDTVVELKIYFYELIELKLVMKKPHDQRQKHQKSEFYLFIYFLCICHLVLLKSGRYDDITSSPLGCVVFRYFHNLTVK